MVNLYLIDIDGTLTDSAPFHREGIKKAFMEVYGTIPTKEIMGKGSGEIYTRYFPTIFKFIDMELTTEKMNRMLDIWKDHILETTKINKIPILPGAKEFIDSLIKRNELFAIITGNPEVAGRALLESTGLLKYFKMENYSDGLSERKDLILRGIDNAKKKGKSFENVIAIGDSIFDIIAAKKAGVISVGVTTGPYTKDELKEAGADLVLNTLEEYEKIFEKVG